MKDLFSMSSFLVLQFSVVESKYIQKSRTWGPYTCCKIIDKSLASLSFNLQK